jgi:hypothetical protein
MSCWACQNARMIWRPSRYNASTASWPLVSNCIVPAMPRTIEAPTGGSSDNLSQRSQRFFRLPLLCLSSLITNHPSLLATHDPPLVCLVYLACLVSLVCFVCLVFLVCPAPRHSPRATHYWSVSSIWFVSHPSRVTPVCPVTHHSSPITHHSFTVHTFVTSWNCMPCRR